MILIKQLKSAEASLIYMQKVYVYIVKHWNAKLKLRRFKAIYQRFNSCILVATLLLKHTTGDCCSNSAYPPCCNFACLRTSPRLRLFAARLGAFIPAGLRKRLRPTIKDVILRLLHTYMYIYIYLYIHIHYHIFYCIILSISTGTDIDRGDIKNKMDRSILSF